ncbi:MAG: hypothetical protein IMY75_06715, partial [Chloroflexi bacterium]|nr:hypothetical protein [Chloroflexota bacterium]
MDIGHWTLDIDCCAACDRDRLWLPVTETDRHPDFPSPIAHISTLHPDVNPYTTAAATDHRPDHLGAGAVQ